MSELAENENGQEQQTLAQMVADIFIEAQCNRLIGRERFFDFRRPRKPDTLKQAVGNVATEQLVEMIRGEVVGECDGVKEVANELSAWQAEAARFRLHELALETYNLSQSVRVKNILEGKLVTVRSRPGINHVIQPAGGWASRGQAGPESVSGYTQGANVEHGRLWLTEEVSGGRKQWAITMIEFSPDNEPILAADLEIEE